MVKYEVVLPTCGELLFSFGDFCCYKFDDSKVLFVVFVFLDKFLMNFLIFY